MQNYSFELATFMSFFLKEGYEMHGLEKTRIREGNK